MSTVPAPTHADPVSLARGFLTGAVSGAALSAFVVAAIIEKLPLFLIGLGLPLSYGVVLFIGGIPRRAREAAVVPAVALARIEKLSASGTESGDIPVTFVLTVVPDGARSYRLEITHGVNLVDLPDYRPGGVVIVQYPPDRPWKARIVPPPTLEWERRVADAVLEPAPESTLVRRPPEGCAFGLLGFLGLLLGAAAVLLLCRAELFGPEALERQPEQQTSSSTSVTSSSGSAVITIGPEQSMLDAGELRRAVDSLARHADVSQVLSVVIDERRLTAIFAPTGVPVPRFDLRAQPLDGVPELVRRATGTLDVGSPETWQVAIVQLADHVTTRVTLTGPQGSASLDGGR
ncbi:hypothetical protein [Amycolatopsis sp. lyj-112]|uniref:hypothetical protein n=1 Tax=Amycolatopsis sp. lyj-112 TaxID=2789288 RepID=UPI00397D7D0B